VIVSAGDARRSAFSGRGFFQRSLFLRELIA
jgi:hypothetical protein